MRRIMTAALLAAFAIPTAAQAQPQRWDREDARDWRDDRGDWRDDRRDYRDDRRDWRDDRRDWRDDRGGYRGFRVGQRIDPQLYGGRYAVMRPTRYGLPDVRGTRRWVRHGGDAILVDWRRGVVLDVARNHFR